MLQKMRPKIDGCHEAYTGWAGDLRVGKCVSVAIGQSSTVRDFRGLHTEQPDHYAWVDAAFVEQLRPVDELVATGNHGRNTYDAGAPRRPFAAAAAAAFLIGVL